MTEQSHHRVDTDRQPADTSRILDIGWNMLVWLVLGLVSVVGIVLALWWQNISTLGEQTDNFYRRNVVARQISADVHLLSRRLEESRRIVNPRRLDQQIDVINSTVQQIMLDSSRLHSDYMGFDSNTGLLQLAGQLQVITRRLTDLLKQDLTARRNEGQVFAEIAADLQLLRQAMGRHVVLDHERFRRLVRIINSAASAQSGGDFVLLTGRLLEEVLLAAERQVAQMRSDEMQADFQNRIRLLRQYVATADLGSMAGRRLDARRELALLFRQAEQDFSRFNELFLSQLDVFDRNEIRDARQSMSLLLNLHMVITVLAALVGGYVLVSMLRNRVIEPLSRELVLLEQVLSDKSPGRHVAGGQEDAGSVEEQVLARARQQISHEQSVLAEAEKDKRQSREDARRAANMAGAAVDAQNAFLASLSHQIRTPMSGVKGMLEILTRGHLSQDQRDLVSVIGDCSDSLMQILDDVHDYSRLESGQLSLQMASFVLEDVVVGVADLSRHQCLERGLDLSVCVDAALPRSFVGDALRLRQVLGHFLTCIIETTDRGSVSIHVSSLTPRVSPVMLRFQVIGTGMPTEDVSRWRRGGANWVPAAAVTDENVPRLGLMISENIVSLMGGQVEPLSGSAHMSGFVFDIPMEAIGPVLIEGGQDLAGLRIGIAEPAVMARQTLENYLVADNGRISVFDDYQVLEDSLRRFDAADDPVRLLLLSPSFEAGEHMEDIRELLDNLGGRAPKLLILTRSEEQRLPLAFNDLGDAVQTLSQPIRRLSLFRAVSAASGERDNLLLQEGQEPLVSRYVAPVRKIAEEASAVVLVGEDDLVARRVIARQLEELGIVYDIVDNGEQVLDALAGGNHYGLVFLDCFMPLMDGFETTRKIREARGRSVGYVPVIGVTGSSGQNEVERGRNSGMDACVTRPVDLAALEETILTWLPVAGDLRRLENVLTLSGPDSSAAE